MTARVKIGISACLLGEKVRYDGDDRRDPALIDALGELVEWVPVCPEVEMGLGVPREPLHLEGDAENPRLVTNDTRIDLTAAMNEWAARRTADLREEDLRGFILKNRSPSCGRHDVAILMPAAGPDMEPVSVGAGLFAKALMENLPALMIEDEEHLDDPPAMAAFSRAIETAP